MTPRPIITLTSDFGLSDSYVARMKGVMLNHCREAQLIDITHDVRPQDILHAALTIDSAIDAFPEGTVHLCVVDPTVGSLRRIVAATIDGQRFVCPDNGLLTCVLHRSGTVSAHEVNQPEWFRQPLSRVFHGRDIMAPVAASWAAGTDPASFGPAILPDSLVRIELPEVLARDTPDGRKIWRTVITQFDHFGNAITALPRSLTGGQGFVRLPGLSQHVPLVTHYAEEPQQLLVALFGSTGLLELAVPGGSAAERWNLSRGSAVEFEEDPVP